MKYRGRSDIIFSMLKNIEANNGQTKTRLMYGSFLSYEQTKEYLKLLLERKLIFPPKSEMNTVLSKEVMAYHITPIGKEFIIKYGEIMNIIGCDAL